MPTTGKTSRPQRVGSLREALGQLVKAVERAKELKTSKGLRLVLDEAKLHLRTTDYYVATQAGYLQTYRGQIFADQPKKIATRYSEGEAHALAKKFGGSVEPHVVRSR